MACNQVNGNKYNVVSGTKSGNNPTYRITSIGTPLTIRWDVQDETISTKVVQAGDYFSYSPDVLSVTINLNDLRITRTQYYPNLRTKTTDNAELRLYQVGNTTPLATASLIATSISDVNYSGCNTTAQKGYLFESAEANTILDAQLPSTGILEFYITFVPLEVNAYQNDFACSQEADQVTYVMNIPMSMMLDVCTDDVVPESDCGCQPQENIDEGCGCVNAECLDGFEPACVEVEEGGSTGEAGVPNKYAVWIGSEFQGSSYLDIKWYASSFEQSNPGDSEDIYLNYNPGSPGVIFRWKEEATYNIKLDLRIKKTYVNVVSRASLTDYVRLQIFDNVNNVIYYDNYLEVNVPDISLNVRCNGNQSDVTETKEITFPIVLEDLNINLPQPAAVNDQFRVRIVDSGSAYAICPYVLVDQRARFNFQGTIELVSLGTPGTPTLVKKYICKNSSGEGTQEPVETPCIENPCTEEGDCGSRLVTCPDGYTPQCIEEIETSGGDPCVISTQNIEIKNGRAYDFCGLQDCCASVRPLGRVGSLVFGGCSGGRCGVKLNKGNVKIKNFSFILDITTGRTASTSGTVRFYIHKNKSIVYFEDISFEAVNINPNLTCEYPDGSYLVGPTTVQHLINVSDVDFDLDVGDNTDQQFNFVVEMIINPYSKPDSNFKECYKDGIYGPCISGLNGGPCRLEPGFDETVEYKNVTGSLEMEYYTRLNLPEDVVTNRYICSNANGDTTEPTSDEVCPDAITVNGLVLTSCRNSSKVLNVQLANGESNVNKDYVYTFGGNNNFQYLYENSALVDECFKVTSIEEIDVNFLDVTNATVKESYGVADCSTCQEDNLPKPSYTIKSCRTEDTFIVTMQDSAVLLFEGYFYTFDFEPNDGYEVIQASYNQTADYPNAVITVESSPEVGCSGLQDTCRSFKGCITGQIITVKNSFDNTDDALECREGVRYLFENSTDFLQAQAWECLSNQWCDVEPIYEIPQGSLINIVECDNCSAGYIYYKLTDCKDNTEKFIFSKQNLIEGKVYIFKEEPSTGYLAKKQEASCADDIENLKVYSFEDVQDVFDSCEQFNKTCYGLVDCETGSVTVSSNDDLAFYVGKVIKWIDPNDPDKAERCASVEEFNCYEEGYVDVTGLEYETCNFLGKDIIFVNKQGTIDSIESEAPNPYGNKWEYIGDNNCILTFSRSLIPDAEETTTVFKFEIDEDNNLQSYDSVIPLPTIEYKYVPGIKAQPVDDVQIEPKDCFDDTEEGCKECTFVEQKDCISESQLENSKVICIDFKGLCNDTYANLFDFLTLGNNEETEYEALLKQLPNKPISTQNKVYALLYDMLSDKQCYDTIRTSSGQFVDSSGVTGFGVTLLKSIEFTSDEISYVKDLIDSIYGYLSSLAFIYQTFIVDYYTWENGDYSEELTPEIFKKTVLNYTNKNGELLSIPFSKGMTVLLDYKKPYYFSNDDYVGNLDYNQFLLSKMQITEEACGLDLVKVECSPNDKIYEKGFFIFGLNFGEDPSWNITENQLRNAWYESEYFNTSICPNLPTGTQIEDIETTYRMLLDKAYLDQTSIVTNDITGRPYVGYPDEPLVIYYPEATQCNTLYYSPTGPNTRFTNVKVVMEKKTHFPSVLRFDCDDISQGFDGAPANWNILEFQTLQGLPIPGNVEDIVFALDESIPKPGTFYWNEVNYEWTLQIGSSIDYAVFSNAALANTFAQELIELGKSLHDLNVIGYDIMTYRLKRFYGI